MRMMTSTTLSGLPLLLLLLSLLCGGMVVGVVAALSDKDTDLDREVNICSRPEELRCPDGHVISVQEVTCGSRGRPCVTSFNQSLPDICQGHQTCNGLGLRDMFASLCDDNHGDNDNRPRAGLTCRYTCVPGKSARCRANVCAKSSQGLVCPTGSVLHIRRVTCSDHDDTHCVRSSHNLLTSLCEGSPHCDASGLRVLLSPHCDVNDDSNKQVLVDYLCVPANRIYNTCSRHVALDTGFGIVTLTNTRRVARPGRKCRWKIPSTPSTASSTTPASIRVDVLMAQPPYSPTGCDDTFLRVEFTDCASRDKVARSFCNLPKTSASLTSCGPVQITSVSGTGQDSHGQFILAYQGFSDSDWGGFLTSGLPTCVPPPPTPMPRVLTVPTKPEDISQKALHDTKLDQGPTEESSGETGSFKLTLKMLLLYILLGALIVILLAALVTILVRYHRMSIPKYKFGDSSENVMLWRRYDDTAMDIFQQNSLLEHSPPPALASNHGPSSNQVIATVHHDAMFEQEEADNRMSMGSGISSFLPPKRDSGFKDLLESFQMGNFGVNNNQSHVTSDEPDRAAKSVSKYGFYDLPEEGGQKDNGVSEDFYDDTQFGGHYSNPNSLSRDHKISTISNGRDGHSVSFEDEQPLVTPEIFPKDDFHYRVNNDEYAVVNKTRRSPTKVNGNGNGFPHKTNRVENGNGSVNFRPTSGPYDKMSSSSNASNSNHRMPRERTWKDEY